MFKHILYMSTTMY